MKIPNSRRERGFTLVELLVVISIIAVLAAAGFAAGNAAIQKARRVTCLASCTALESGVNNFFTEYGYMPKDNMNKDEEVSTKTDLAFLNELLGINSPTLNTRTVKFLSVKEGKRKTGGGTGGLVYQPSGTTLVGLFDPWGGVYRVMLDGDFDEKVKVQPKGSSQSKELNGRRVAAWSDGADGVSATGKSGDDVITW